MPEIKNQFTGGKMNKDVDERLVPNGEYRDAMNIQVATSEGSDVGTAQNILGNELQNIIIKGTQYDMPDDAIAIGVIADEKNDILYYLVWSSGADYILSYNGSAHSVVFYDETNNILKFSPNTIITGINVIDGMLFWTDNTNEPRKINIQRCIDGTLTTPGVITQTQLYNESTGNLTEFKEKHLTVIKKGPQYSLDMLMSTSRDRDKIYTGVVQIYSNDDPAGSAGVGSSFIGGSFDNGIFDFSSISTDAGSNTFSVEILTGLLPGGIEQTLVPPPPFVPPPPLVPIQTGPLDALTGWFPADGNGLIGSLVGQKVVLQAYEVVDPIAGTFEPPGIPLTDFVIKGEITQILSNDIVTGAPQSNSQGGFPVNYGVSIKVTTVDGFPDQPEDGVQLKYIIDIFDETEKLFEFKFPRFSYRYKYADGEYSTFAPFTQVAFLPGAFDYHPRKGYNLGMTNKLKQVELLNVVTDNTPDDVVAIDILFKDDASPSIYVVDTIKPNDWAPTGSLNMWNSILLSSQNPGDALLFSSFVIEKEAISSIVPENQLLRPWDNVPRKALGQDVTGNRIVYANYVQNYDVLSQNGLNYIPNINITHELFSSDDNLLINTGTNVSTSAYKSIKSLREYQLGVVFLDEHGRETPVLSNTSGTVKYEKIKAETANRFGVQFDSDDFPQALTHFKFFVKETSSEYYNLAMDRFYGAGDGNIWLSFPSSDRNKVDIDTFLIMKKGTDSDTLVTDAARYKILAIESEAPDFVKTAKRVLVTLKNTGAGLFSGTSIPTSGTSEFKIKTTSLYETAAQNIDTTDDEIWVEFEKTGSSQVSDRYRVVGVTNSHIDKSDPATNEEFTFKLDKPLGDDVNFISNDPSGATSNSIESTAKVVLYRYRVENLDRFDGRFFVKIYFDDTFKKNIVAAVIGGGIRKVASRKVYLMDQELVAKHTSDLDRFATRGQGSLRSARTGWNARKFLSSGNQENLDYGYYSVDEFTANALYFRKYREKEYTNGNSDYGVSQDFTTPALLSALNNRCNALVHLAKETSAGINSGDNSAYKEYKGEFFRDAKDWWKEFGYNTNGKSTKNRKEGKIGTRAYGVTSSWQSNKFGLGRPIDALENWTELSDGWFGGPRNEIDFYVWSYKEYTSGYESDKDSAKDTDVWFIDGGPSDGHYYDTDTSATLEFDQQPTNSGPSGGGLTTSTNNWSMDLGFGGIIPPSTSGTNVWNGKSDVPGFWDVGAWLPDPIGPPNSNYADESDFITRTNAGFQFKWDEDPTNNGDGTEYVVNNVNYKNVWRHSDGRHLPHYTGGTHQSAFIYNHDQTTNHNNEEYSSQIESSTTNNIDDLHSMAEGLSFNMSKQYKMQDITPAITWDPTEHGVIQGGFSIDLSACDSSGSVGGTTTSSIVTGETKQEDLTIYVNTINFTQLNGIQVSLQEQMALISYTSGGALITLADPYVVREIIERNNGDYFELRLGGYTKPFQTAEHTFLFTTNIPDIGENYFFAQVGMNGYSPNSEFNINTIAKPKQEGTGFNESNWGAVGAVGYTLSWYDFLEESEVMSDNPAIFETEPKDLTALDIYYEASGSVPMQINADTIASALPIGTRFSSTPSPNPNSNIIYTVTGYVGSQIQVQGPLGSPVPQSNTLGQWKFFRPDDLIISMSTVGISPTPQPNVWLIGLFNQVVNPDYKFILPWHNCYTFMNGIESNRIRDNYNLPYISNGVKASTTLEQEYREERRKYGLIYSGIYNSVSGINNLNQFIQAEKITKDVNPIYGSIQKLYSRDSDLVALCEDKILRISANKDALFNADGKPQLIATDRVLGQTIPFSGEFGISTNPESFASESYRAYFSDKVRGAVLRLSKDGLTPISDIGMKDWFRDNLRLSNKIIGSYDDRNQEYNIKLEMIPRGGYSCDKGMDVAFIVDYTSSMGPIIDNVKAGVQSVINTIQGSSGVNNYRLALVTADESAEKYDTFTNSYIMQFGYENAPDYISLPASQKIDNVGPIVGNNDPTHQIITAWEMFQLNNGATFSSQLNKLNGGVNGIDVELGSGMGTPEPTDFAAQLVLGSTNLVGAFRPNVARYIIIITDAPPSGDDDQYDINDVLNLQNLATQAIAAGVKIFVLGQGVMTEIPGGGFVWQELANQTGGSWNVSADASVIVSEIIASCSLE